LTIDQAVQLALDRNLNVSLARSQVEVASARVNGAFGSFLPIINVSGGYTKELSQDATVIVQGIPIPTDRPDHNMSAAATASLTLFDGFGRSSRYSSARNEFDASMRTLEQTRQEITYQARAAFLNALRSDQIIEIRESDLEVAREQLAQNREMVEAGSAQIGTVYSQEAEVANAELSLEQSRTDATIARNNLSLLLNYDPTAEIQLSSEGLASSVDTNEIRRDRQDLGSLSDMLDRQAANRRDLQAAKLKVESAASQVTAARAGYWPIISTGLGYYWSKAGAFDASGNTQFSLNFQYSPFDGFQTSEQVQLAEAQRQSAEIDLERLENETRSNLEQSLARLDGADRQLRAADKAVAAARQNRYATDERFKAGAGSFTDYLLANAQYLTAQVNQVNAVFNYRLALYEVRYQIGE
jgi:outer membrane protein TolC